MRLLETDPRVVVSYFARFVWVLKSRMAWVALWEQSGGLPRGMRRLPVTGRTCNRAWFIPRGYLGKGVRGGKNRMSVTGLLYFKISPACIFFIGP